MKTIFLSLSAFLLLAGCNKQSQSYRENQEEVSKPNDYTTGKDVKKVPNRPAERSPSERREKPEQGQ